MDPMSIAPYSTIIKFLAKNPKISIDLLAKLLRRDESEIEEYLFTLEKDGVITLEDRTVQLEEQTKSRS